MNTLSLAACAVLAVFLIGQLVRRVIISRSGRNVTPENVKCIAPYPVQPIKGRERYRVMMDMRKLDMENWLTIDKYYMDEHRVRSKLLEKEKSKVLQCLPESYEGCMEMLEEVVEFLCRQFPNVFECRKHGNETTVYNRMTGETFVFGTDNDQIGPLEIAVRLTMEDLSVLMKNSDGEYYLAASASLFPVGWTVEERIGWTISKLHDPVPLWHQQVASSVSKFLGRLTPASPMERSNYFIEVRRPNEELLETLYRPNGLVEEGMDLSPRDIIIRRERQTFRRLPRSDTIAFGVKTFLTTLDELPLEELKNLEKEIKSWPDFVGEYKGKAVWGAKALEFCKERTKMLGCEKVEV
ncbi:hypothetical protein PHISCL_03267 [Aspergillus sclerotialis]|uniref:Mannosyl transferase n=1 Tax=Aspergillus sclerotialis TaxID=2070753 RepID=A0A3A2ZQ54_9EURO|nr:hypothetical protein PHISCL_03267 [Aspergillus sclerotialis]